MDGIHFSDATTTAMDVGWRAVAANLSDLAASGAVDIDGITVALVAPGHTRWDWVDGVYQGISAALRQYGGVLLGGDCSKGKQRLLSITALGRLGPLRLHRNAALPGDVLVTSGPHGLSRLGLALLQDDPSVRDIALCSNLRDQAIARHQHPTPRLKERPAATGLQTEASALAGWGNRQQRRTALCRCRSLQQQRLRSGAAQRPASNGRRLA